MRSWLPVAFFLGFFVVGVPYWLIPYHEVNLPSAVMGPGLLVVAGAALTLRLREVGKFWRIVAVAGAAVPAAVFARVVWDGLKDPTTHNLWPIEVVIALLLGFTCALAGAVAGALISALTDKLAGRRRS